MYNCNCMCPIKSTSATNVSGDLEILFPDTSVPLQNCDTLSLVICQTLPIFTEVGDVYFMINGVRFRLKSKFGNFVKTDQIKSRKKYCVGIGTEIPSMVMLTCIPQSSVVFPTIPETIIEDME